MIRNQKAISFATALVFCLSFLAPLLFAPQAAVAVTASEFSVQNVSVGTAKCGSIHVEGNPAVIKSGATVQIQLLDGAEFIGGVPATLVTYPEVGGNNSNNVLGGTHQAMGNTLYLYTFTGPTVTPGNVAVFEVNFGKLGGPNVKVNQTGDVRATLTIDSTQYGPFVIARAGSGSTTSVGLSHPSVTEGNNQEIGDIKITEDRVGVMVSGTQFSVTLPDYVTWVGGALNGTGTDGITWTSAAGDVTTDGAGLSKRTFTITSRNNAGNGDVAATIVIESLNVNIESDCANGDINVNLKKEGTTGTFSSGTAWVAVKGDYTVNLEQGEETVPTIYAGQYGKTPGTIRITETSKATLVSGRSITIELPAGTYWNKIPKAKYVAGTTNILNEPNNLTTQADWDKKGISNKRKVTFMVDGTSTVPAEILIYDGEIAVLGDTDPGEVQATIAGSAGVQGTVLVANIEEPVTVNVDPVNDVIIGLKNQQTGTVTITEAVAGVLRAKSGHAGDQSGVLQVIVPDGCSWTVDPTIEVTSGDLKLDGNNVTRNGATLSIPIKTSSTTPSVITITGIELTVNRTVPEGTLVTGLRGAALDNEQEWEKYIQTTYNTNARAAVTVTSFVLANCVTPAPTESVSQTYGTFTLGSSIYYVNGMAKLMDVAVFAQDGRIFVPQRFLGLALGIPDENIVWDQATQTATFTTLDGKVIVFTVGSNIFTVDGVEFTMDVTPQVVDGRICLPVRFMVEALGGTVGWDQATQTAFFSLG